MVPARIAISIFVLSLLMIVSCEKSEEPANVTLTLKDASEITETSFVANWTTINADVKSLYVEVSNDESFDVVIKKITIQNHNANSQLIDGLDGASKYYFRLKLELNNGEILDSNIQSVITKYVSDNILFTTSDGLEIAGKLIYLGSIETKKPGIIFMHELGVWVNNWKSSDVVIELVSRGYVCLVFDFRGHGNSEPIDDIGQLIEDWSLIGNDLKAAIQYLQSIEIVQGDKIGLVGASLGGIMAIAGNGFEEVKTSVAISAPRNGTQSLFPGFTPKSVFYMAGDKDERPDPAMNFAEEAEYLYKYTDDPKKLSIVEGSSSHGTDLLLNEDLAKEVIDWVDDQLSK